MSILLVASLLLTQTEPASQPLAPEQEMLQLMRKTTDAALKAAEAAERSARAAEKAVGLEPAAKEAEGGAPKEPPKRVKFAGNAGLSLVWLAGNSNALTGTVNVGLTLSVDAWTLGLKSLGAYGESRSPSDTASQTNAANFYGELKASRNFTDLIGIFLLGGAGFDRVAKVEYRAYGEAGATFTFIKQMRGDQVKLGLGAELGVRYQRESWFIYYPEAGEVAGRITTPQPNIVNIRAGANLRYAPVENVIFTESLDLLPDVITAANFNLLSNTALMVKLVGPLSIKTTFSLKFDNLPPPGAQKVDTALTFGIDVVF